VVVQLAGVAEVRVGAGLAWKMLVQSIRILVIDWMILALGDLEVLARDDPVDAESARGTLGTSVSDWWFVVGLVH